MSYQLVPLREQPQHSRTIAEWIHRQWWSTTDTPVDTIERWLRTHLGTSGFPTTFVVVSDGQPIGSVSLHDSEAEDRPDYKPFSALYS
jgi:hypothetical protein